MSTEPLLGRRDGPDLENNMSLIPPQSFSVGDARLDVSHRIHVTFHGKYNRTALSGLLGRALPSTRVTNTNKDGSKLELNFSNQAYLAISHKVKGTTNVYRIEWSCTDLSQLKDVFFMTDAHWYGATQVRNQEWPIEKWRRPLTPYVAGDSFADQWGGVQERYWLSSNGAAIFLDANIPLFVGQNHNGNMELQFVSKYAKPYKNPHHQKVTLNYNVYTDENIMKVHQYVMENVFAKPKDIPDERMFTHPVWSTWARFKKEVSEIAILDFAEEINQHGFPNSQLEIDDKWESSYGDLEFDSRKFPDPRGMTDKLHQKGFRVTLWVHPFTSRVFRNMFNRRYMGACCKCCRLSGLGFWWNGLCYALDVTNDDAVAWYNHKLQVLKDICGVDSFKFDAGEIKWFPFISYRTSEPWSNPNMYTLLYAENIAAKMDTDRRFQEVRVGFRTQHLPMFVRMMDKDSNWTMTNGLKTLIPHVLTFGLIGYPFVLPDMIGGNGYKGMPDRELFIRWLQVNVFMPALQFSYVPWQYDEEAIEICRKFVKLHEEYAPRIIELAEEAVHTGHPINRPLWWIAPKDETAQKIDSEFLLGNTILVAPVLNPGARSRDIYLPAGRWKDELNGDILAGGQWHVDYKADLHELPYFTKVNELA